MYKKYFKTAVAITLCTSFLLTGCKGEKVPELIEPMTAESTAAMATKRDVEKMNAFVGYAVPNTEVAYFEANGELKSLDVKAGDVVTKGQVLGTLNEDKNAREISSLNNEISYTNSSYDNDDAKLKYELDILNQRYVQLNDELAIATQAQQAGNIADPNVDTDDDSDSKIRPVADIQNDISMLSLDIEEQNNAIDESIQARATEIKGIQSQINLLNEDIVKSKMTAPISGTVSMVSNAVSIGDAVDAYATMVEIITDDKPMIEAHDITESDAAKAKRIYSIIDEKEYELEYIPYTQDEKSSSKFANEVLYPRFAFVDETVSVEYGKTVAIYLVNDEASSVISVPSNALNKNGSSYFVVVLDKDGKTHKEEVEVGLIGACFAEIKSGLSEGEFVVIKGSEVVGGETCKATREDFNAYKKLKDTMTGASFNFAKYIWNHEDATLGLMCVDMGSYVHEGDVIAKVKRESNTADIQELKLKINQSKASYDNRRSQINKEIDTLQKQINTETNVYELAIAKDNLAVKQLEIERCNLDEAYDKASLEEKIENMQAEMGSNDIIAPIDGYVFGSGINDVFLDPNLTIPQGTELFVFENISATNYEIYADKGEYYYGEKFYCGKDKDMISASVIGFADGEDKNMEWVIIAIDPEFVQELPEDLDLDSEVGPGLNIDVDHVKSLMIYQKNVITIDTNAIFEDDDDRYVYVLENGYKYKQYVKVGANDTESGKSWIVDGLSEGQEVILK